MRHLMAREDGSYPILISSDRTNVKFWRLPDMKADCSPHGDHLAYGYHNGTRNADQTEIVIEAPCP